MEVAVSPGGFSLKVIIIMAEIRGSRREYYGIPVYWSSSKISRVLNGSGISWFHVEPGVSGA